MLSEAGNGVDSLLKAPNVSIRIGNQIINRFISPVACISFSNEIAAPLGSIENPLLQDSNRNFLAYQAIACSPDSHPAWPLCSVCRNSTTAAGLRGI
jgi:hypothetical protein